MEEKKKSRATSKANVKGKTKAVTEEMLIDAYVEFVLEHGKPPVSVYKFMKELGAEERTFYSFYPSLDVMPVYLWKNLVERTAKTCENDENWETFGSRERILAFYYTLVANLNENRSFFLWTFTEYRGMKNEMALFAQARKTFKTFINELISIGAETEEILERPFISRRYADVFWFHFVFIVKFWKDDSSRNNEDTDAAIEKSVRLAYELLGRSALDTMLDLGKFLYQHHKI